MKLTISKMMTKSSPLAAIVILFSAIAFNINAQTQTFTSSGTYTVPSSATAIKIECIGGGGGGSSITNSSRRGAAGGGGAYALSIITVTAGSSYSVTVGTGGVANTGGRNSTFNTTAVVAAGGGGATGNSITANGVGGSTASSIGTVKSAGGNGADGDVTTNYSGGGGGAAGSTGAGGNGTGSTAGIGASLNGGNGGAGVSGSSNGNAGSTYGGGGSGACTNSTTHRIGGSGANGLVVVTVITTVEVNATSGTTLMYYTTLKGAFDAINAGTHQGTITIKINGSTTETATAVLNASGTGSASYTSVTLYPTASSLVITGALTTPLVQLNGADNMTIDGRVNQSGSSNLIISNTSTGVGARTIELINSSQNNNIQYCIINGAGTTATQGVINLSTSSSGTGNDGNYVQYCKITGVTSTNRPVNAIYSGGTSGAENSGNIIRNNEIYDCLMKGTASNGIFISSYSTGFTISGNSFYETTSFAPTASVEYASIRIDNSSGNDFVVSGNYIGGSLASCAGTTAWTKTNAFNNTFNAIYLNLGTSNNSVQDNTIQHFSYANSGAANWYGIYIAGGGINVGTSIGNTIGATSGTGSITFTAGLTGAIFSGIYIASTNTITCSNNTIGSITTSNAAANATNFYGIYKTSSAGTTTISTNIIGSATTASSINTSSASTGNSQILYGIYSLGTGIVTISGNTIQNLVNSTTETTLASRTRGVFANDGSNSIQGNSVSNLKTGGVSNGTNYDGAPIIGIALISTVATQDISDNTVNGLETTSTAKIEMYGIYYNGAASGTNTISRNFVSNFIIPAGGSTGSYIHGISQYAGNYTTSNNIVYLGNNITVGCSIWGIWNGSTNAIKIYHNTIYLSGVAASGASNSYAFRSLNCPSSTDIRNNILWDGRTNSSGPISHYAIYLNCTTNLTLDYNDYQYAQQFGIANGTTYNTFTAWQTALNIYPAYNEAHSLNIDPQLVNLGGTLPVDYQTNIQLQGVSGTGITTDYDGVTRVTPTMGAWEFFSNPVEIWNGSTYRNAYSTLKGAFDVINAGTYTGDLTIKFRGNTTETAAAVLNASGTGLASYTHILIYPARSGITVTSNLATPMVDLSGADKVTFDGRVNGSGSANEFSFINTSTSSTSGTSTFRFINTAENDTVRYCNIKGASTATTGGTIYFATATSGNGNDGNVILSDSITSVSSSNRPINTIYSYGSPSYENSGNIIQNNFIYNFLNPTNLSYGININSNSTAFTISGNSFYETSSFAPTASVDYSAIFVNNTSGGSNVISGNYIGGSSSLCSGTLTKTSGFSNIFFGININTGSTASSVQGNVIKNINWSNTGSTSWYGMNIGAGNVNVGTTSGNTIGAITGTGSITLTNTASGGNFIGITIGSTGTVDCENNNIGSVTVTNASTNATHFYGINKGAVAGTTTISNNLIGSTSTANSVNASSVSSSNAQYVFGINSAGTGSIIINGNEIANTTNGSTNSTTATAGRINGIAISDGTSNSVTSNTVHHLSIANSNNSSVSNASVIGIVLTGTNPTRTVSGNTIYNLSNTFINYAGAVYGLYYEGSTSGTNTVLRNFIYSLTTPNNGTTNGTLLTGIRIYSGVTTYSNNIINLIPTTRNVIYGIYDTGTASQTCNLYFNTVHIGGTEASSNISAALRSNTNANTCDYRNNIFSNVRSGGSRFHYGIYYNYGTAGTITVNYNDYYAPIGNLAYFNGVGDNTIPFIAGQDANSVNTVPGFNSPGSTVATDYRISSTLVGINGTGISIDYGANSRPGTNPTMGAWETNSNKWVGTYSTNWNDATNWSGNLVPAADASIEFYSSPLNHLYLDQDRSVTNITNAQSTYRVVTNGHKLTIKGSLNFTGGAQIDANASSSTIEFAGSSAQSIPSGSLYNNGIYDLLINNADNVTLNGTLKLLNAITSTSGYLDASTNSPNVTYAGSASQSLEDARYLSNTIYDLTIDNSTGVNLNTDITVSNNLVINSGKSLTISVANQMLVQGTVTNNAGTSGLVIKSSSVAPNGSFIFYNSSGNPVPATVEMYSKAAATTYDPSTDSYSDYKWQYFGVPLRYVDPDPTFTGSVVRIWKEAGTNISNHWLYETNDSSIYSFRGYEITQISPKTIYFTGQLENANYSSRLPYTLTALYPGQQILSNPYTAAIDIRQLTFGTQTEATVYQYNCGSYSEWTSNAGEGTVGDYPGQYTSSPQNLAGNVGIPRQIPSMQGFLVKAMSNSANATLAIPYSSTVMKNADQQRVKNSSVNTELPSTYIEVKGSRFSDRMWLFTNPDCTHAFDNGWDGLKNFSSSVYVPQIFVSEPSGDFQISTVDNINNTQIGFYSGEDSIYTLTINQQNTSGVYPTLYLIDQQKDTTIDISETGTTYTFLVRSTDTLVNRFKIVINQGVTTSTAKEVRNKLEIFNSNHSIIVHNYEDQKGYIVLYDISGKFVFKHPFDADGITTIKAADLPTGVYIAKAIVGDKINQVSRFIIK